MTDRLPKRAFIPLAIAVIICCIFSAGCPGPQGPPTYPVSGTVTFDGQPLSEGRIIFEPIESDGTRPSSGEIKEGEFSFEIEAGNKRVRVIAEREVGEVDPTMGARRRENFIPDKYSDKSELTAEVTTVGENNKYEFTLKSR